MRIKVLSLVVIFLLVGTSVAWSSLNFNFIGAGARARGMGGAFIGVADDATAIGWNPAGLATLQTPEASAAGLINMNKQEVTLTWDDPVYQDYNYEESASSSHFVFEFASIAYPLAVGEKNFVIAAAYQRLVDLYDLNQNVNRELDIDEYEEFTGGIDAISPGAAMQLTPDVAVGAAFNIWTGSLDYKYEDRIANYDTTISDIDKFSGFNVNIGALASYNQFKFGAVVKTPLTIKDEYEVDGETYKDEWKFPLTFGFGASVMPNENLTLAVDYEIRNYSNMKIYDDYNDEEVEGDSIGIVDGHQIRVGAEYIFVGESTIFPARVGFRTDPQFFEGFDEDKVTGYVFTAGFGVIFGNIWIDAAYEFGTVKDDFDFEDPTDGFMLESKETNHNIIVSAVAHFE
ncbi:MAG: hypothetical protein GF315_10560 [candidate division Zixibacteria bacterium]|nr:hypothetical protein [candidate division Zixibacteria bacterium]